MLRLQRLRLATVIFPLSSLILAGTTYAWPKLVEPLGLDVWNVGRLEEEVRASQELSDALDGQCHDMQEIITLNHILLDDLTAGRIDLVEAAKQKWQINHVNDFFRTYLDRASAASDYEAKTAHELIAQACDRCDDDARPVLAARLRDQYEVEYGSMPSQ